jgi:hypothetical protein
LRLASPQTSRPSRAIPHLRRGPPTPELAAGLEERPVSGRISISRPLRPLAAPDHQLSVRSMNTQCGLCSSGISLSGYGSISANPVER